MNDIEFSFQFIPARYVKPGMWVQHREHATTTCITEVLNQPDSECLHLISDKVKRSFHPDDIVKISGDKVKMKIPECAVPYAQMTELFNKTGGLLIHYNDEESEQGKCDYSPAFTPGLTLMNGSIKKAIAEIKSNKWAFGFLVSDAGESLDESASQAAWSSEHHKVAPYSTCLRFENMTNIGDCDSKAILDPFVGPFQVSFQARFSDSSRGGISQTERVKFTNSTQGWNTSFSVEDFGARTDIKDAAAHLGQKLISIGTALKENAHCAGTIDLNSLPKGR